jgi:hypothetical protein
MKLPNWLKVLKTKNNEDSIDYTLKYDPYFDKVINYGTFKATGTMVATYETIGANGVQTHTVVGDTAVHAFMNGLPPYDQIHKLPGFQSNYRKEGTNE